MKYITLEPAYGRDYKTQKEVKAALDAGKDFQVNAFLSPDDGRMVNKQDLEAMAPIEAHIRFKRQMNICVARFK
jgi:hypothetical protein